MSALDITGLVSAFGRVPSFHDAHLLAIEGSAASASLRLYVYEPPAPGLWKQDWDDDLHVVCTLRFVEVQEFRLVLKNNWLYRMAFEQADDCVAALVVGDQCTGEGRIVAREVILQSLEYPATSFSYRGSAIDTVAIGVDGR